MHPEKEESGKWVIVLIVTKILCCGLPILLLSGIALTSFSANILLISATVVIAALVCFIWYKKRKKRETSCADGVCVPEQNHNLKYDRVQ